MPTAPPDRLIGRSGARGFTLVEVGVVVVIAAVLLSISIAAFSHYSERTSANRAAMVFARDLTLARSMAVRGRQTVTITFDEPGLWYRVATSDGRQLALRRFGATGDVSLSGATLELAGDSLQFSSRGFGNLSGASLGTATFRAGNVAYQVTFNSMGASKVGAL